MSKQVKPHFVNLTSDMKPKCVLPDSLVQSTTALPLHVSHRDDRGPISLAGPGPPSTLRRLCLHV